MGLKGSDVPNLSHIGEKNPQFTHSWPDESLAFIIVKCICNDGFPMDRFMVADEQCTESCKGDPENTGGCGGDKRMSVYLVAEKNANTPQF